MDMEIDPPMSPTTPTTQTPTISSLNRSQSQVQIPPQTPTQQTQTPPAPAPASIPHQPTQPTRLQQKIAQMRLTIAPIVHVETGSPAPSFPPTMLHLFLLTETQLDTMAAFYAQTGTPTAQTYMYPQTMDWDRQILSKDASMEEIGDMGDLALTDYERLKVKMRMFARFIGMRGAETPTWEYERQVEMLRRRIERSVEEEERREMKGYRGPPRMW